MSCALPCQRCDRAVHRRIDQDRPARMFATATDRLGLPSAVFLCSNCLRTLDSLLLSVARAAKRGASRWRHGAPRPIEETP